MKLFTLVALLTSINFCSTAAVPTKHKATKPAAFFLAGDSTTAVINAAKTGGGWGDGFLATLKNGAIGFNYGHNGATTVSFRNGGDWANVLAGVAANKAKYKPFVTIQFGHNDQKPAANISTALFSSNLKQFGLDVRAAGGEPIFVTSLSRRNFNSSGVVVQSLAVEAAATISVAKSLKAFVVDLNKGSTNYLNSIGQAHATEYNLIPTDNTHLNVYGQALFGNMVSLLMNGIKAAGFKEWTTPNATIAKAIQEGVFILPSA